MSLGPLAAIFIMVIAFHMFSGGNDDLLDLPTDQARPRMREWPDQVSTSQVKRVSRKSAHAIDSHSTWYRIELDEESAKLWADQAHLQFDRDHRRSPGAHYQGVEAVRRTTSGPKGWDGKTGDVPDWWQPAVAEFRTSESMLWYKNSESGVGSGVYTAYDPTSHNLWIYEFGCQHYRLWEPGKIPDGEGFSLLK